MPHLSPGPAQCHGAGGGVGGEGGGRINYYILAGREVRGANKQLLLIVRTYKQI